MFSTRERLMNIAINLESSARFFPNKPAVRSDGVELTYSQLNDQVNRVATGLIRSGVEPGELIGLCAPNSTEWIIFYFGVIKAGATAVTYPNALTSGELTILLKHSKPRFILTTPNRLSDLKCLKDSGMIKGFVCVGDNDLTVESLMNNGTGSFRAVNRERDDIAAILYTGGTTGQPKGVMLTHEGINFSSNAVAHYERSSTDDHALCFQPLNHVFGQVHIMNSTILSAGCLELLPGADLEKILDLTEKGKVTKFFSVPTMFVRLLGIPDLRKKLGRIKYCFSAAASMAKEIVERWKETTGITITESYGMTEFMPISFNHFYPEHHIIGSVGQAICGVEVQIRDMSGNILDRTSEGEICVRGRSAMKGYLYNQEATGDAFWERGWLRTGDIGILEDNDFLYIVDRLKDLIITGGENVYPNEVEKAIIANPDVLECAVIGVPDREWGECVTAFIKLRQGKTLVADQLKSYLKTKLAPFKVPKEYVAVDELPKSPAGKVLKRELKRAYIEKDREGQC
jgi:long-chain acyl-CoA synthetase